MAPAESLHNYCISLDDDPMIFKIIQEIITLVVFATFAYFYFGEPLRWNYAASFLCVLGAVAFAFWGRV